MARIRTIKPEFWTDERLTECSLSARLMFIGMLNFADDNGNQAYSAKRLKMQIFPADAIDTQPLIDELITHGVVIEYSVSGEKFLHIKGFAKHQVINRRSLCTIPQPDFIDHSVSTPEPITAGREGKGEERKEEGEKKTPRKRSASREVSLSEYLDSCKAAGVKPIPADHHIRDYCRKAGITDEMVQIAWITFRDKKLSDPAAKKQIDWPGTFANAIKGRWDRIWLVNAEGVANWSQEGIQAKRVIEAKIQEREHEPA